MLILALKISHIAFTSLIYLQHLARCCRITEKKTCSREVSVLHSSTEVATQANLLRITTCPSISITNKMLIITCRSSISNCSGLSVRCCHLANVSQTAVFRTSTIHAVNAWLWQVRTDGEGKLCSIIVGINEIQIKFIKLRNCNY